MSAYQDASTMIRVFDALRRWTYRFDFSDLEQARRALEAQHVMDEASASGGLAPFELRPEP